MDMSNCNASIFSLLCLAFISLPVVCMLCVINVPHTSGGAFYMMAVENLLSLALCAMLISFGESVVRSLITLIAYRMEKRGGMEESVKLYYISAKKEMENEIPMVQAAQAAHMEVLSNMNVMLKLEIERHAALKSLCATNPNTIDSIAGSDVFCGGISSSSSSDAAVVAAVGDAGAKKGGGDYAHDRDAGDKDSSRSAALTA